MSGGPRAPEMSWPDVKAWRRAARARLIGARVALPAAVRADWTGDLAANLRPVLAAAPPPISFYWPFKGEPDLRPLMRELAAAGIAVALEVVPRTLIAPIVGFDGANYRLGYGGGFFDRTLAKLAPAAQAIGVGFSLFGLPTIHPQPHDVPMARIVTEAAPIDFAASASPVCYLDEADPDYRGFLSDADLAAALRPLAAALAPERLPLLEFVLWRLADAGERRVAETGAPADMREYLSRLMPRTRDDAIHRAVDILRRSFAGEKK